MKEKGHSKNYIKWLVFPGILLLFWLVATFIYSSLYTGSFSVISYNHSQENFISLSKGRLLKGDKITGEFVAKENKLGIVAIRFKQQQRIPWKDEDILIFRIKEKRANNWYYQNEYYSGLTFDVPFLPIGFPIINDSKGKTYHFELESKKGNEKNGLEIGHKKPIFSSRYQMSKNDLLQTRENFLSFIKLKIVNSLDTPDILFSSLIYLLPLVLYLIWIFGFLDPILEIFEQRYTGSKLKKFIISLFKRNGLIAFFSVIIITGVILYDILYIQVLNDMLYIVIIVLWLIIMYVSRAQIPITILVSIFFLILSPVFLVFGNISIAEKAGAWAFVFLTGGVFVEVFSLRKLKK